MTNPGSTSEVPTPGIPPTGSYFGDYFLIGELGRGGMGEVWLARQESLNRRVALKWIRVEHPDSVRRQRFRLEAEAAARLSHENIVRVFDVGEIDGRPYIAMEYMEGGSLADTIDGKDWGATTGARRERQESIATLLSTVARAVHDAHQHGVLHRDLKPGNILLDADGVPHVADFGLAKLVHQDEALSLTGQVMGSPGYLSPEQASGKNRDLTTATDVFSMGAILYHALAGRAPFGGATWLESLRAVQEEEPTQPSVLNPGVDPDLETICLKCLEKEPSRRYGSAEVLANELDRWVRREPILARPVTTFERVAKWARRRPAFAGVLAGAMLLALIVLIGSPIALVKISAARNTMRQTLANSYLERGMNSVAPNRQVEALPWLAAAYEIEKGNARAERVNRLRLAGSLEDCHRLIQVVASTSRPIRQVVFSPDGRWMATAHQGHSAQVWDAETGKAVTPVLQGTLPSAMTSSEEPAFVQFHPTASLLLASTGGDAPGLWDLSEPNAPRRARFHDKHLDLVRTAQFSADGRRILSVSDDRSVAVWDALTRAPLFNIRTFAPPGAPLVGASFAPNGERFCVAGAFGLKIYDAQSGKKMQVLNEHLPSVQAVFHPDGRQLSSLSQEGGWQAWDLHRGKMRFYVPVRSPQFVAVSASGDRVAIASGLQCYVGISNLQIRLDHEGYVERAEFSPDGMLLATGTADRMVRLWTVHDGQPVGQPLAHTDRVIGLQFSPDGSRMLTLTKDGLARIWQLRTPAGLTHPSVQVQERIQDVTLDSSGEKFALATQWGHYSVLETRNGKQLADRPETRPPPNAPRLLTTPSRHTIFAPDGARLVVTDSQSLLSVFDIARQQVVTQFQVFSATRRFERVFGKTFVDNVLNGDPTIGQLRYYALQMAMRNPFQSAVAPNLNCVEFSPDGRLLLAASDDGSARLFDSTTWEYVGGKATLGVISVVLEYVGGSAGVRWLSGQGEFGHTNAILHAAFNHRGDRIVTASVDHSARLWMTASRELATPPLRHAGPVQFAAFSPDDTILATASQDGTARLWDPSSGRELPSSPLRHDGSVTRIIFSPNGRRLATGSDDGTARVWETATGRLIATAPVQGRIIALSFLPDGELIFAAAADLHGRLWDTTTGLPVSPPIGANATHATLSRDGRSCLVVEGNTVARIHRVNADVAELPDESLLLAKAKLYSGRRLEPTGRGLSSFPPWEFKQVWDTALKRWPAEFSAAPGDTVAWHEFWHSTSKSAGNSFAARFHAERLNAK